MKGPVVQEVRAEVLGLSGRSPQTMVDAFKGLLERVLGLVVDCSALAPADPARVRIDDCRRQLDGSEDMAGLGVLGDVILDALKEVFDRMRHEGASAGQELMSVIAIVRDAVTAIAGEEQSLQASLKQSAQRFDALREISDIRQLKMRLALEVNGLKQLTAARDSQWRSKVSAFERRVAELEDRLIETHAEATHDPLTGIANRRQIAALFARLRNERRSVVAAMIDVDDFKAVNDKHGHPIGDGVLQGIAKALRAAVRTHDIVGRMGGDEFVVMLVDVSLAQAEQRLRSMLTNVAALAQLPQNDEPNKVTISCGLAELSAGDTMETLMSRADQALYDAKRQGKNRVLSRTLPYIRDLR